MVVCLFLPVLFFRKYYLKQKKLIIDNGQFWLGGEPNTLRISRIEYVAQDLYFSIHFEEKIDSSTYLKKETDLFMNDYKYPLSNETLRKMF